MNEPLRGDDAVDPAAPAEQDYSPSLRFRVLFTLAMVVIALGYTWVWRARTERVQPEPPPVLALSAAVSYISEGEGEGEGEVGDRLLAGLRQIRGLTVVDARVRRPAEPAIEQVLNAELRRGGAGHVLELRRADARSGKVIYVYRVEGATLEEAVYRMSVQVAMSFGLPRPAPPGGSAG